MFFKGFVGFGFACGKSNLGKSKGLLNRPGGCFALGYVSGNRKVGTVVSGGNIVNVNDKFHRARVSFAFEPTGKLGVYFFNLLAFAGGKSIVAEQAFGANGNAGNGGFAKRFKRGFFHCNVEFYARAVSFVYIANRSAFNRANGVFINVGGNGFVGIRVRNAESHSRACNSNNR